MTIREVDEIAAMLVTLGAGDAHLVDPDTATRALDQLAALHVADPSTRHWWSSLKSRQSTIEYGDDAAAWSRSLEMLMSKLESKDAFVAITDDEERPWPVVAIEKTCLARLLGELSFFEYFVFEPTCNSVVFDTHHNTLIVATTS